MKAATWTLLLFLEACMAGDGESAKKTAGRGTQTGDDPPEAAAPPIELVAGPEYWLGFPMVVQVTVKNSTRTRSWYALPACRLLKAPGPVAFRFTGAAGQVVELAAAATRAGEGPARGFDLEPGQARTMLFDMSELDPALSAGAWNLTGVYTTPRGTSVSPAIAVTLVAPTREDSAAAAMLRAAHGTGAPSWSRLLDDGPPELPEVALSAAAWRQLAFHEAVHRVVVGTPSLDQVDPATFDGFDGTPLAGEAALLRLELLEARGDSGAAALRATIAGSWPGLRWRLEEMTAGSGWLSGLRRKRKP